MSKILTIGEPLVRLSTSKDKLLRNSSKLDVAIGGAEYNVAWNLGNLGHDVAFATRIPNNSLGKMVISNLNSVQVATDQIILDEEGRIGAYYLELGNGLRSSNVIYDRKHTALSTISDFPWEFDTLFQGVSHFHITGITLSISEFWKRNGPLLLKEAKKRNIYVSFDMNYRESMWKVEEAKKVYQTIIEYVDALSASYLDAKYFFDIKLENPATKIDFIKEIGVKFPNLSYIYGTDRKILTPNSYEIQGFLYNVKSRNVSLSKTYTIDSIIDRVGSGDSFASGILDGILNGDNDSSIVDFAIASSVLKHSVLGDINPFNREEILEITKNKTSIVR